MTKIIRANTTTKTRVDNASTNPGQMLTARREGGAGLCHGALSSLAGVLDGLNDNVGILPRCMLSRLRNYLSQMLEASVQILRIAVTKLLGRFGLRHHEVA